ncbi:YbjN domain-containing protein [Corynebacterium sp. ES2715-CONJ3]|uniref:YbjN domain-containing protein n=1 Tax=Corynebacterium sp. ES2715-CONJ3 TaxID=2974028 RepID=UPI002166E341|nr:YbjN domain-containing protein [Corynebacterium sp. ES2715-CONJ3]MCS4491681.1 YbjN domain-containing protein [Corynebacterium sp. ES2715-CONJ3]
MAWFKKTEETTPVTKDRLEQWFSSRGYSMSWEDDTAYAIFDGFYTRFDVGHDALTTVGVHYPELPIPPERIDELTSFVETRNREGSLGICYLKENEGHVDFVSDHSFITVKGASDEQIDEWIDAGISAQLGHAMALCEQFGIQPPVEPPSDDA